jgi:hypothetical protein
MPFDKRPWQKPNAEHPVSSEFARDYPLSAAKPPPPASGPSSSKPSANSRSGSTPSAQSKGMRGWGKDELRTSNIERRTSNRRERRTSNVQLRTSNVEQKRKTNFERPTLNVERRTEEKDELRTSNFEQLLLSTFDVQRSMFNVRFETSRTRTQNPNCPKDSSLELEL